MDAERVTSRKNPVVVRLRALAADAGLRRAEGEFVCDGGKLLTEALDKGAEVTLVVWKERARSLPGLENVRQLVVPAELFDYVSPMKNSPGPLFSVRFRPEEAEPRFDRALLLENVQDPGNVGTLIRTAAAMGVETVILCGACARSSGSVWCTRTPTARRRFARKTACRSTAPRCQSARPTSAASICAAPSSRSAARGGD